MEGVYISEIAHKTLDPELSEKFAYLGALLTKNIKYDSMRSLFGRLTTKLGDTDHLIPLE